MTLPSTKTARHRRIVELLSRARVHSQTELAGLLGHDGLTVTQATLSRDLDELGAVRIRDDDGALVAFRKGDYKYVYAEQRAPGLMQVWAEPFTKLRLQKTFNLLQDPFERADITSNTFWDWQINHVGQIYGAMDDVGAFALTFKDFPPRSFPPSFVPTNVVEEMMDDIKDQRQKAGQRAQSIEKIRSGVNQMIEQQLQQRGVK